MSKFVQVTFIFHLARGRVSETDPCVGHEGCMAADVPASTAYAKQTQSISNVRITWVYLRICVWRSGGRLNKKDGLTRYGNSHVKDKTS